MKRTFKKAISVFLVVAMLLCAAPLSGFVDIELPSFFNLKAEAANTDFKVEQYQGHSYAVIDISLSWTEAKKYCESLGGHLVTITSQGEQNFINEKLLKNSSNKRQFWLGGYYTNSWKWVTNEKFVYSNWYPKEPTGGQYYLAILGTYYSGYGEGMWFDNPNRSSIEPWTMESTGIICEWEYGEDYNNIQRQIDILNRITINVKAVDNETNNLVSVPDATVEVKYNGSPIVSKKSDSNGIVTFTKKIFLLKDIIFRQ